MPAISRVTSLWPTRDEAREAAPAAARGTLIGLVLGLLPGGGALLSSFVAYTAEKRLSRTPARFGQGAPAGVAAPEAANNAGAQTAFVPLLTLGLPSNAIMALLAGAMLVQGIIPGPRIMTNQPELFWGVIASMWIGNLMLLVINLPLIGLWVQLLKLPYRLLYPSILIVSAIGVYSVNYRAFDVYLGRLVRAARIPPAQMALRAGAAHPRLRARADDGGIFPPHAAHFRRQLFRFRGAPDQPDAAHRRHPSAGGGRAPRHQEDAADRLCRMKSRN